MNTVVRESPALHFEGTGAKADQAVPEFNSSFFYFTVELPLRASPLQDEMSDAELLQAAEASGTFRFLDDEAEDVYH